MFSLVVAAFLGPALLLGAAGGKWGSGVSAVFLAICCTATQVFPYHCSEIMGGQPPGIDILLGGSLLTAILWGLILYLPSASSKPAGEPTTEGKVS